MQTLTLFSVDDLKGVYLCTPGLALLVMSSGTIRRGHTSMGVVKYHKATQTLGTFEDSPEGWTQLKLLGDTE